MSRLMFLLRRRKVIVRNDNNTFSVQSVQKAKEEYTSLVERKKQEIEQERQEQNKEIKKIIIDFLTQSEKYYAVAEMIKNAKELSEYTTQRLTPIVREMVQEQLITSKVEKKRDYYAIAGIEEKLEKKRIEEEKKREEQRIAKREYINKKIKMEEEK